MSIINVRLTEEDKAWAESWCRANTYIIACLTTQFTEADLKKLIAYEAMNYGREDLLFRMTARYNKLRRQREWIEIRDIARRHNAIRKAIREKNRSLPQTTS